MLQPTATAAQVGPHVPSPRHPPPVPPPGLGWVGLFQPPPPTPSPKVPPVSKPIYKSAKAEAKAREEWLRQRHVEDLRDDTLALVLEGVEPGNRAAIQRRFDQVEANGGATSATLWKWFDKRVTAPQMPTVRATLRSVGKDLGIVTPRQHQPRSR